VLVVSRLSHLFSQLVRSVHPFSLLRSDLGVSNSARALRRRE
jgi:hypothetical protein